MKDRHIGQLIHLVYKMRGISATDLAKATHTTPQNLNLIFKRSTMDIGQLLLFSKALSFNFFDLFSNKLKGKAQNLKEKGEWEWSEGVKSMALGPNVTPEVEDYEIWLVENTPTLEDELAQTKAEVVQLQKAIATMEKLLESKEEILELLRSENKRLRELSVDKK